MGKETIVATDSASSMTKKEMLQEGVACIPLHIVWPNGKQDTDFTISPEELYQKMPVEGIPTTSGATPKDFREFFNNLKEKGIKQIFSINVSGKKSMTVASAEAVAPEYPELKIDVLDSQGFCLQQLMLVKEAVKLFKEGFNMTEVKRKILERIPQASCYVSLGTRENIVKSGRLKGAQAFVASVLNIIPVIKVDKGDLLIEQKAMGVSKGRKILAEILKKEVDFRKNLPVKLGIMYTKTKEVGEELKYLLEEIWKSPKVELFEPREAGAALGVHAGPDGVGWVAFWSTT